MTEPRPASRGQDAMPKPSGHKKQTDGRAKAAAPPAPTHPALTAQVEHKPRGAGGLSTFEDALAYLHARVDLEKLHATPELRDKYKLDRMAAILEALGNPHDDLRCVHVAGTKGKGSTCEMIAACLGACGYTVGLFTSPHLVDIRERIRIDQRLIQREDFLALTRRVAKAAGAVAPLHGEATFFELTTAIGFLYFLEQAVDVAVIEVGLGGLLDCTNVIRPEVAAITMIGYDHTQILGSTLEEIARQKAGIFKPGVPAITIPQEPAAMAAIRETANRVGAPLCVVGEDIDFASRFEFQSGVGPQALVALSTPRCEFEHVVVPLRGEHQALNCGLALAVVDKLIEHGFDCPEGKVIDGLERTTLPGRFEQVWDSPRIIADGAHNPESIRALMKAIGAYMTYDSLIVVFGCASDKDTDSMLRHLAGGADKVIFTASKSARAADPTRLMERYLELSDGSACQTAPDLQSALDIAARACGRGDLMCVCGSFYLVGETKIRLEEVRARRNAGAKR
ncbi:MAG: bifunctional folylpolyglutamate synthase/dihydrofolate synthase [Phycisphaerales bacterium]